MNHIKCTYCGKAVVPTVTGKYRKHNDPATQETCEAVGTYEPGKELPPEGPCQNESSSDATSPTAPSAEPSDSAETDAPAPAESVTSGMSSSPISQDEGDGVSNAPASVALDGVEEYAEKFNDLASAQYDAYRAEVNTKALAAEERRRYPFVQPAPHVEVQTLFRQPGVVEKERLAPDSTALGFEIQSRLKEMFYAFSNRQERSQQTTLGPSEIGSPCDRRLAMSLMRMPRVNPGGDGWASFVGTCVHAGLADMLQWADAGGGRYAVEMPLTFPTPRVPKGTGDVLDRVLLLFGDHKVQGRWSRNKLRSQGPGPTYRVQIHTYAYGARLRGEKVEHVAIISWPRDEASLDDMYVWTEPYNPAIARDALARVDSIADAVEDQREQGRESWRIAKSLPIADDCRFCPYYLPGAKDLSNGACNGKN